MRRASRLDANHAEVRAALRAAGWIVQDTANLRGYFLDLMVSKQGVTILVEVKPDEKIALTAREEKVVAEWPGLKTVVYNVPDALYKCAALLEHWR